MKVTGLETALKAATLCGDGGGLQKDDKLKGNEEEESYLPVQNTPEIGLERTALGPIIKFLVC